MGRNAREFAEHELAIEQYVARYERLLIEGALASDDVAKA
jgi:hypothetical protein